MSFTDHNAFPESGHSTDRSAAAESVRGIVDELNENLSRFEWMTSKLNDDSLAFALESSIEARRVVLSQLTNFVGGPGLDRRANDKPTLIERSLLALKAVPGDAELIVLEELRDVEHQAINTAKDALEQLPSGSAKTAVQEYRAKAALSLAGIVTEIRERSSN